MPHQPYFFQDGTRAASVTTIISSRRECGGLMSWAHKCGLQGIDYRKARDAAADAGTLAHKMIEEYLNGRDPEDVLDLSKPRRPGTVIPADEEMAKRARTSFRAFMSWQRGSGLVFTETEIPLVSEEHRFGGCPDAVGKIGDELVLVDFKTGRTYADHIVQCAAYRTLYNENREKPVYEAHLIRFDREHGVFMHKQIGMTQLDKGWTAFLHLKALYELDKELGRMAK